MITWQLYSAQEFDLHHKAWDGLNQSGAKTPLLDSRFVATAIKYFGNGNERLAIAGSPDNPTAMAIISNNRYADWSSLQPSQAPLGFWLACPNVPLEELLRPLASTLPGLVLLISLTQQDPVFLPRPLNQGHVSTLDYIQTAHIDVNQSFDEYWMTRGKNLRHNLKRQRNRLEREGVSTRLEVLTEPADMPLAVHQYGEMESSGWKNRSGSAVHIDNAQGRFYADSLSALAATGQARVYRYYYDEKLVASDLCVLGDGVLIILKTTYDETIEGSSPTMLMRQEMFNLLFDEGTIRRIEFYGKVMDWHTKWSDNFRVMYHINYYPWKLFGTLRNMLHPHPRLENMPGEKSSGLEQS